MIPEEVRRVTEGVNAFAAEMKTKGIHVGMTVGPATHCVTCGDRWPCEASKG